MGEPFVRVLGHRLFDNGGQGTRGVLTEGSHRARLVVDVLPEDGKGVGAFERHLPRQQLVQDAAEGVDVGAGVRPFAAGLLRRHVVGRAHHHAGGRDGGQGLGAGYAEIGDLRRAARGDEDVLGLDVPVNDARCVRFAEAVADLSCVLGGGFDGECPDFDDACQALRQELHGHEVPAVVLPHLVDLDDVGVGDRPRERCLPVEPLDVGGDAGEAGMEDLDGDEAVRVRVERARDRPLRSGGDLLKDPEAAYSFLRHRSCSRIRSRPWVSYANHDLRVALRAVWRRQRGVS